MSIQAEIDRINTGVVAAYAVLEGMGATMPDTQNVDNLAATVLSLPLSDGCAKIAKIWENASPTSTFAAQTISRDLSEYDAISIYYKNKNNGTVFLSTGLIPVRRDFTLYYMTIDPASQRRAGSVSITGITFAGGFGGSAASDACAIPIVIYGYKGIADLSIDAEILYKLPGVTTFDGVDDYIDTGVKLFDTPRDFTVILDFDAPNTQNAEGTLLYAADGAGQNVGLTIKSAGSFPAVSANGQAQPFEDATTGAWGHTWANVKKIALVYSAGVFQFGKYCEAGGTVKNITAKANNAYIANDKTLLVGVYRSWDDTPTLNFWTGTLNDLRIYASALTEGEVVNLINSA